MKTRQVLAALAAATLGIGVAATVATPASAHVPAANLTCSLATVSLTQYDAAATATVTLDGQNLHTGTLTNGTYTLNQALTATVNHTLDVVVDSPDGNGTEYDFTYHGKADNCVPVPPKLDHYEVGIYIYKKLDSSKPAAWENSGTQTFCKSKSGTDWFTTYPCTLPKDVCGPGWAYQQDKVKWTDPATFSWPKNITYDKNAPNGGDNIGWPPIYDAKHDELSEIITVPPCDLPTKPIATPDPVTQNDVCGPGGSYTIPASTGVLWSINGQPVQPGTYQVNGDVSLTVVAAPDAPDYGFAQGTQTQWPVKFTSAGEVCGQLQTLAATGPVDQGLIRVGLGFLVLGLLATAFAMRRRRDLFEL